MKKRQVVITGIGTVNACGMGYESLWQTAVQGRSAIRGLSDLSFNDSPIRVAGQIPDFKPEDFVKSRKSLKVMSRDIQLAVAASQLAVHDAGILNGRTDATRMGVTLSCGLINNDLDELGAGIKQSLDSSGEFQMKLFGRDGIRAMYPLWLLKYLPNMPACHISILHGLKGPSNTLMTSSTGGVQAVGEAFRVIQRGDADVMLAGASDSKINPVGLARLYLLGILSERNHIPSEVYRPFDRRRDGMVVGEGAGIFILEEKENALKRGARIYGEIIGYSARVNSQEKSMNHALEEGGRDLKEITFIHAHGSGVPEEDVLEARAISKIFNNGWKQIPVTASKSITGHLVDAVGTVELTLSLLSLQRRVLPPIVNLEEPDPACDLNFVKERPKTIEGKSFLLHAYGFGGQSAALVITQSGR